jgi:hypothetical protein
MRQLWVLGKLINNYMEKPTPGSDEAIKQGCTCPVMDNHYGKGAYGDGKVFWYSETCPIHN